MASRGAAFLLVALLVVFGSGEASLATPPGLDRLDREHLLMLMGGGLETWTMADTEILIGAVPWFVEMFVTVPPDVVIRASRAESRGGAAVVTLRGGDERRLEEMFQQLEREGWTRRQKSGTPLPPAAARLAALEVFCRADASIAVWKARATAEGLDLKVSYRNGFPGFCRQDGVGMVRGSSVTYAVLEGSIYQDPAVRTLLEVPLPAGGQLGLGLASGNGAWGEVFSRAITTVSTKDLLDHYAEQLGSRGWSVSARQSRPGFAMAVFDSIDGPGSRRGGVLIVSEDVVSPDSKTLSFRFDRTAVQAPGP